MPASSRSSVASTGPGSAVRSGPGDTLELEVELDQLGSTNAGKGHGTARVGGQVACQAGLLFVIVSG